MVWEVGVKNIPVIHIKFVAHLFERISIAYFGGEESDADIEGPFTVARRIVIWAACCISYEERRTLVCQQNPVIITARAEGLGK
jgi:hypothetical protein